MALLVGVVLGLASCTKPEPWGDSELQYPVIFVPGLPGSVLKDEDNGDVLWGRVRPGSRHTRKEASRLALPLSPEVSSPGNGGVVADGVLERVEVRLLGGSRHLDIYAPLMRRMDAMEPDPARGKFFHSFAYDWRLDCAENGRLLHRFMERTAAQLKREFPEKFGRGQEVRFDIVAHSMGALVTRYALSQGDTPLEEARQRRGATWKSADRCRKFIMVNPANGGCLLAHERLLRGYKMGPMLPDWSASILGTHPSMYQVLPMEPNTVEVWSKTGRKTVPLLEERTWREEQWGLFAPEAKEDIAWLTPDLTDAERGALVARHVSANLQRAKDFHRAMEGATRVPAGVEFHLLMGTTWPTTERGCFDVQTRKVRPLKVAPGDGMVTLRSALYVPGLSAPKEESKPTASRWTSVLLGPKHHITGIASRDWIEHIEGLLTDVPTPADSP